MIALLVLAAWIALIVLVVGLCVSARRGDLGENAGGEPLLDLSRASAGLELSGGRELMPAGVASGETQRRAAA
jgi:hypothetical protein